MDSTKGDRSRPWRAFLASHVPRRLDPQNAAARLRPARLPRARSAVRQSPPRFEVDPVEAASVQPQQAADPRWIAVAQSGARVKARVEAAQPPASVRTVGLAQLW